MTENVRFLGVMKPEALNLPLSASDISVLASTNEGWANAILEAMACGVPVVASNVGGNSEVISGEELGRIYDCNENGALFEALSNSLSKEWNTRTITKYAMSNGWDVRVEQLLNTFLALPHEPAYLIRHA